MILQETKECSRQARNGKARTATEREPQDHALRLWPEDFSDPQARRRRYLHHQATLYRAFHQEERHPPLR